jgi:hypothetical protein
LEQPRCCKPFQQCCFSKLAVWPWRYFAISLLAFFSHDVVCCCVTQLQPVVANVLANLACSTRRQSDIAELHTHLAQHLQLLANITRRCWHGCLANLAGLQSSFTQHGSDGNDTKLLSRLAHLVADITESLLANVSLPAESWKHDECW